MNEEELIKCAEEIFNEYPYPEYIGNGLFRIAPNCICGERMMNEIFNKLDTSGPK